MSRPTTVKINLAALQHNLQRVREVASQSKIIAMVKADGYGHGLRRVSDALIDADAFGVACLEEALLIRGRHPNHRIILMEGIFDRSEFSIVVDHDFEIVIHQPWQIDLLAAAKLNRPIKVWIKVDTGMHRLGILPENFATVWQRLNELPMVAATPKVMTHFSDADETDHEKNQQQLQLFQQATAGINTEYSLANSAAILALPESHADWVRPGIMLYGVSPFANSLGRDFNLQAAMTVQSALISIKYCKAGDSIGYGSRYICEENMPVGVIAIGYGDGYPRHAKTGTPVWINGATVPLIGQVSMDMICIDLRDHPQAKIGDRVILWGPELPVEIIARHAETIAYELVCNFSARQRVASVADP